MASDSATGLLHVQVCYAEAEQQILLELDVTNGTTLEAAILQSQVLQQVPEIDLDKFRVGIFGKIKTLDTLLRDRDRIEIYRPLIADPKDTRRLRAAKKDEKKPH